MISKKKVALKSIFTLLLLFGSYSSIFLYTGQFYHKHISYDVTRNYELNHVVDGWLYSYIYPTWNYSAEGSVRSVEISEDGKYFAAASIDGSISLFNTSNPSNPLIWTYDFPVGQYSSVSISSEGEYIVGHNREIIYFFNKSSGSPLWTYNTTETISKVAISSDGNYIVALTMLGEFPYHQHKGKIFFFNNSISPTKMPMWNYTIENIRPITVAISSDGNYTAVGGLDCSTYQMSELILFNKSISPIKTSMWTYSFPFGIINEVAMNSNASYIVVADGAGYVYYFKDRAPVRLTLLTPEAPVYSVDISPNGRYIAAGCINSTWFFENKWTYFDSWLDSNYQDVYEVSTSDNGLSSSVEDYTNYIHWRDVSKSYPDPYYWYSEPMDKIYTAKVSGNGEITVLGFMDSNLIMVFNNTVRLPSSLRLNILSDSPDTDGNFNLYLDQYGSPTYTDNYSIYHFDEKILQINSSLDLIEEGIIVPFTSGNQYQISDVASGTHYFRVVAYNEYGYSVSWSSPYSPVIVSLPPRGLHLSSTADNPDPDGQFNLNWNVSTDADYYFVYEYTSLITEINGSLDLIGNNLTVNTLLREGYGMGDYYFMVVASNEIGTQNSNCIKITVGEPALSFWEILERYGLFIGLIAGSIILAIALIIRKKIPKGIRVFISHAVNDFESYRIEQLAKYLESQKEISHVYYCEEDLIGDIDDWMMKTVPKCQLLIFFSSNNSLNSADCIMELRLALKHNIQVTPILGIDMDWKDLELKWEDLKLDLSRQLGKEFNPDEFDKFNKDLYSYILKVKQDLEKEIIEKKKGKKRK